MDIAGGAAAQGRYGSVDLPGCQRLRWVSWPSRLVGEAGCRMVGTSGVSGIRRATSVFFKVTHRSEGYLRFLKGVVMNVVIWVLQVLLALAFLVAGVTKLSQPRQKLAASMGWVEDFSDTGVRIIGALEMLAGVALLPPATGVATVLVPLAAVGLALLMVGAAATHRRRGELPMIGINAVLLLLAVVVAWARFGPYPL
jgi:uncharacterized membrane protein YphA (DoxX/SURF4 family)